MSLYGAALVTLVSALALFITTGVLTGQIDRRIANIPISCTGRCRDGANGTNATITLGNTTTLAPGANATVTDVGPSPGAAVLNFGLPEGAGGARGFPGGNASIDVTVLVNGSVSAQYSSIAMNVTLDATNHTFVFTGATGRQGENATVAVGSVVTLSAGANMTVTNVGNVTEAVFDFALPRAAAGTPAAVSVGMVVAGAPGTNASVVNTGNASDAVYAFTLPTGDAGTNASIAVGSVTAGANASVSNAGNATEAVYDFVLPILAATGEAGDNGNVTVTTEVNGVATNSSTFATSSLELTILVAQNVTIVPVAGPTGEAGAAATAQFVNTNQGVSAAVTNAGTPSALLLDIVVPRGAAALATSIAIGNTSVLPVGANATVTNAGTPNAVLLECGLPQGQQGLAATFVVANTTTLAAGQAPTVVNVGNATALLLEFGIPQGTQGTAAGVSCVAGNTTQGAFGSGGSVTNVGTAEAAILNFVVPTGAFIVTAGTTTGGNVATYPSGNAAVTNGGTSLAPILNFVLPQSQLSTGQLQVSAASSGSGSLTANVFANWSPWAGAGLFLTSDMISTAGQLKYTGPGTTAIITLSAGVACNTTARVLFRVNLCTQQGAALDFTLANTSFFVPFVLTCVAQLQNNTLIAAQINPSVGSQVFARQHSFLTVFSRLR